MTRVKICGLMSDQDVELCVQAGVHAVGFVVDYPVPVPWNLTKAQARQLIDNLSPFVSSTVVTGGTIESILDVAEATRPDIIQLHHQETLSEVKVLAQELNQRGIKTIKALRIDREGKCDFELSDPVAAARALAATPISALLVDSYTASRPGGTGITVDLSIFRAIRREVKLPLILAGGLNPANVLELVAEANPYAVDVLTGVEEGPGQKDAAKVCKFMQCINEYIRRRNCF